MALSSEAMNMKKKCLGFSVIGILASIAIFTLIIGSVYNLIQKANEDAEAHSIIEDIRTIFINAIEVRKTDTVGNYADTLSSRQMMPAKWIRDGSTGWFDTPWGRGSVGGVGNWFGENPPGFTSGLDGVHVFIQRIPAELCFQVVNVLQTEVDYISINAPDTGYMLKKWDTEYTRENALAACNSTLSNNRGYTVLRTAIFK